MTQSLPPGDIVTQPASKMIFNAPFEFQLNYDLKVTNNGSRRIGFVFETNDPKRLVVQPPCGVLDPNESVLASVLCRSFAYGQVDTTKDQVTIDWVNAPVGAMKQFSPDWLELDGIKRRKNLAIGYNP